MAWSSTIRTRIGVRVSISPPAPASALTLFIIHHCIIVVIVRYYPINLDECSRTFLTDGLDCPAYFFNAVFHNTETEMIRANIRRVKARAIILNGKFNMAGIAVEINLNFAG